MISALLTLFVLGGINAASASAANQVTLGVSHDAFNHSCATPEGNRTSNGTVVTVWPCTGSSLQTWYMTADGYVTHPASGKCLTPSGNASGTNGAVLTLWTCDYGNPNSPQRFTGDGAGFRTVNGGKCVTNKGNSWANGTWLTLWTCPSSPPTPSVQRWEMIYSGWIV
ncbi:RICIN domain-containing protein [Streptomyces sp. NBC_01216]|uniref:RICIN domain-containing protein n=1 Tax=unclassified Streptomyces TaxID=2593676 RepID=UPI002E139C46|nr:RICIN domain-containing protein [Streptomyces sp. NBC_01216]